MASNSDEQDMVTAKTETTDTKAASLEVATWQLKALTEALGDLTLTVSDSLSVGRGSDNDVVLGSKQVSRNHALLSVLNGKLYVKDLDSSNGTFINDARIEGNKSQHLKVDDTIGFASFAFQVMAPMASIDTESSRVEPAEVEPAEPSMDSPVEPVVVEDTVLENTSLENIADQQAAATVVMDSDVDKKLEDTAAEPVVKETIIEEVLSSTASDTAPIATPSTASMASQQEIEMSNESSKETLTTEPEPLTTEPLTKEAIIQEPVRQKTATHSEPTTAPKATALEHDKTTKTELQEEANPDVLRAKQAATGQLSGTANLGQAPDVGTEGNNAMDQAVNNPANAGHVEKKPSGGWFIWVFIAVIIIGLALWLFNMGGA